MGYRILIFVLSVMGLGTLYANNSFFNLSKGEPKKIDMSIDALYWYTEEGIDWAYTRNGNTDFLQTNYLTLVFDWAAGYRIGLGYNMAHDLWDTQASFTQFQSSAKAASDGPIIVPGFIAARLSLLEPFISGNAHIRLLYNMFDWDIGRSFLTCNRLCLRPSIGLKGGWITQKIYSNWVVSDLINAEENLHQSFKGGGPKGGVSSKWSLGNWKKHCFSLIAACEAGYLWGYWTIQDEYLDTLETAIYAKTTPRNFASVMLHGFVGFGWNVNFNRDLAHFGLKLGYEVEDWFNQLQIFTNINGAQNNDLILQGLSLQLFFAF